MKSCQKGKAIPNDDDSSTILHNHGFGRKASPSSAQLMDGGANVLNAKRNSWGASSTPLQAAKIGFEPSSSYIGTLGSEIL